MRQQHIHSANGDKTVLPEARGWGEGKNERWDGANGGEKREERFDKIERTKSERRRDEAQWWVKPPLCLLSEKDEIIKAFSPRSTN